MLIWYSWLMQMGHLREVTDQNTCIKKDRTKLVYVVIFAITWNKSINQYQNLIIKFKS